MPVISCSIFSSSPFAPPSAVLNTGRTLKMYGHPQADWFYRFLSLPHGIASRNTIRRVFSRLDPDELTYCFIYC